MMRADQRTMGELLLYWDYDTQWGADRSRAGQGPRAWGGLEFTHTDRLITLLDRHGVRSCFAVVAAAALPGDRPYHDPGQVRALHDAGHEIGSHSLRHEWLPALPPAELRDVLRRSREVLEDCIGAPVRAFVPPYNQPFDHPAALSFSLAERRAVPRGRTDVAGLCRALAETGFTSTRLSYRSWPRRLAEAVVGRELDRPSVPTRIAGITTVLLNTPGGFGAASRAMVDRVAGEGGIAVVYAHPHSLGSGGPQDERQLLPFLERVEELRAAGRLHVTLPRELVPEDGRA